MAISVPSQLWDQQQTNYGQNGVPISGFDPGTGSTGLPQQSGAQINAPWSTDQYAQANQWANDYVAQNNINPAWGNSQDLTRAWEGAINNGQAPGQAAQDWAVNYLGWGQQPQGQAQAQPQGGPGGGGGGGFDGSAFGPWSGVSGGFQAPAFQPLPNAPTFNAPAYRQAPAFSYADFKGPSVDEALNDPSYKFRLSQGNQGLQNWAAARGTLNSSDTAKALSDYNQNAASQEYSNIWNRDLGAYTTNRAGAVQQYNTNYQTQYADPYTASYQAAKDAFAPQMAEYQTNAANIQHENDLRNQNAWGDYYLGFSDFQNRRNLGVNFALSS